MLPQLNYENSILVEGEVSGSGGSEATREGPVKAELQVIHIGIGGGFTIAAIPVNWQPSLGPNLKPRR